MAHVVLERRGHGPPLLLLPGAGADARLWDDVGRLLAPPFELHLATIAGFAGRPHAEGALWPAVRDELAVHLSTLEVPPVVVGHSWGGFLAWSLVVEGAAVRAVVVIDSMPALGALIAPDASTLADVVAERVTRLSTSAPQALSSLLAPSIVAMTRSDEQAERILALASRSDPTRLAQAMAAAWLADLRPALANRRVPTTLVLPGDERLPAATRQLKHGLARQQVADLPVHRVVEVPRASHYVMLDQPEALAAIIHDVAQGV